MAVFRLVAAVIARIRPILAAITGKLNQVLKRIRRILLLITIVQIWASIVSGLDRLLRAIRRVLGRLGAIPFPPLRLILPALRSAIAALIRLIRPLRALVQRLTRPLKELEERLRDIQSFIKGVRSRLRRLRAKLAVAQLLAQLLERQQAFLESIFGQRLEQAVRALLDRLTQLSDLVDRLGVALEALIAALDVVVDAADAVIRELDRFFQRVKALLDLFSPLQAALDALEAGIQQLRQNRLVRLIIDGLTSLLDQLDVLFDALLNRIGLRALLDRLLRQIPGVEQIQAAIEQLLTRLVEVRAKVDEIRRKLTEIQDALDQLENALDQLIAFLQSFLFFKTIVEVSMPRIALWPRSDDKFERPQELPGSLRLDDESASADDALAAALEEMNAGLDGIDSVLGMLAADTPNDQQLAGLREVAAAYLGTPIDLPPAVGVNGNELIAIFDAAVKDRLTAVDQFLKEFKTPELTPEAFRELLALEQIAPEDGDLTKSDLIKRS